MHEEEEGFLYEKIIVITINTIENVIRRQKLNISFLVEHNKTILGESSRFLIQPDFSEPLPSHDIDFSINFGVEIDNKDSVKAIVSTPILIKAIETEEIEEENEEEQRKIPKVLGICNVDLIPILLGEESFSEKLMLETPRFSFDASAIPGANLPVLTVTISQDNMSLLPSDKEVNFLYITLESIYNLPPTMTDSFEFIGGTIAFVDSEVPENVYFEKGKWKKFKNLEGIKHWNSLIDLESRGSLSKYKLDCDYVGIKKALDKEFDLAKKVLQNDPRIEWNAMNRSVLWSAGEKAMKEFITRHKYWPFQFLMIEKSRNSSTKAKFTPKTFLYQSYVDISELLYPGKRSTRVAAELCTYNASDMPDKLNIENIFDLESLLKDSKEKTKKSKATKSVESEIEAEEGSSTTTENLEPAVIVIEIELYNSFIPRRKEQDFIKLISNLTTPKKSERLPYSYSTWMAEKKYKKCIQELVQIITESYRDFRQKNSTKSSPAQNGKNNIDEKKQEKYCFTLEWDEEACFTQYLYKSGVYLNLLNTLRTNVTLLLDQKFAMPSSMDTCQMQNFITTAYTYLVMLMRKIINQTVEGHFTQDLPPFANSEQLYFYAEEAYEMNRVDDAKRYYTKVIALHRKDSKAWTKYAIFNLKIGELDFALECCLEAIALERRSKISLLLYAGILFKKREFKDAETILQAVTELHPRFVEGWAFLHLFYIKTENSLGTDLMARVAKKCLQSQKSDENYKQDPLAWSMAYCPRDSIYMVAATFLLKIHLLELAELALLQELGNVGETKHVMYYFSVVHYLSNRYKDALPFLKKIECTHGLDHYVSCLMGHCFFKLRLYFKAKSYYDFAHMLFDRPDNVHLLEYRMGLYYRAIGKYGIAKKISMSVCNYSPTPKTWLLLGICSYELNDLNLAESALIEANSFDNCCSNTWGYLCLLNLSFKRLNEFIQCYRQALKNNLRNKNLLTKIKNLMGNLRRDLSIIRLEALYEKSPSATTIDEDVNGDEDYIEKFFDQRE